MDGSNANSNVSIVGIDVSKSKLDVMILPEVTRLTCTYDAEGIGRLIALSTERKQATETRRPAATVSRVSIECRTLCIELMIRF